MAGASLRILHISDLHARGLRDSKRAWKRAQVLGDEWLRNLDELASDGRAFDLVVFTGDIADWGLTEDYADATQFVEATLERLDVPVERLFVVPGNHDVHRKTEEAAWAKLREGIRTQDQAVSEWFADSGKPPFGFDPGWRDAVLSRTQAFWTWVERDLGRSELIPRNSPHGRLGYSVSVPGLSVPMRIIGLDSAWLAGDNADAGKLWLTEDQLGLLCRDAKGKPWSGFRLALMHHPLSDLADHAQAAHQLGGTVDILLRGHQHDPIARVQHDPDRTMRELAAGCVFEGALGNRHPNGCHVIDVGFDGNGRPQRYEIHFRTWSERGHWHSDSGLYREAKGGRLVWPVESHTDDQVPFIPLHVGHPASALSNAKTPVSVHVAATARPVEEVSSTLHIPLSLRSQLKMTTPYAQLSDLLRSMFSAPELRHFLRRLPNGADIVDAIPEGLGIALLAGEAVSALERRGQVNRMLFETLILSAPDRYDEIADVAGVWGVVLSPRR